MRKVLHPREELSQAFRLYIKTPGGDNAHLFEKLETWRKLFGIQIGIVAIEALRNAESVGSENAQEIFNSRSEMGCRTRSNLYDTLVIDEEGAGVRAETIKIGMGWSESPMII